MFYNQFKTRANQKAIPIPKGPPFRCKKYSAVALKVAIVRKKSPKEPNIYFQNGV
jgi:hypothetical protein